MEDFPANSRRAGAQEEPKKIERVTSAETVRRKKGLGRRMKETFVVGNGRMAFEYMFMEVVVPAIQNTMIDAFQGGIERLIRGESNRPYRPTGGYQPERGHVAYNRMSTGPVGSRPPQASPRTLSRQARARHGFEELVIPSRQEAEEVLDQMFVIMDRYGSVTVADLYELTGIQSSHTDMKWGWTDLRGSKAQRLRQGGFLLDIPEPQPLG